MQTNRMRHMTMVVFLVAFSISIFGSDVQRCTCVNGPPDYLCPSAPLLQVYIQHELYCTRYYKCINGRAIEYKCPNGLYFESVNNTCTCDFASCYRSDPCIQYVECCRCCRQQFVNTGLAPENFYICFNDGYALATTCPVAFNPCTGAFIQLVFINGKCEVPPANYLCPTAPLLQVYLQHELFCTRYYKCTDGRAIEFQCPYGLFFDTVNNTCTCDFTLCYRNDPCIQFVDNCRCCKQQFDNTGLSPENFYVCYNDGYAVATTCPLAFDPCTGAFVQLEFINGKCEVPPAMPNVHVRHACTEVAIPSLELRRNSSELPQNRYIRRIRRGNGFTVCASRLMPWALDVTVSAVTCADGLGTEGVNASEGKN
uniref:Chitin-binding type-2 domain-containing protein n=1 Tax=Anopheles culicifacies TaxID=139723 RepID=A0A182MEE9_9DIPT